MDAGDRWSRLEAARCLLAELWPLPLARSRGVAVCCPVDPACERVVWSVAACVFERAERELHAVFCGAGSLRVGVCAEQLTDALKKAVNEKLGNALAKVGRKVTRCDVMLTVNKNPSIEKNQEIEVVISVKGAMLRTKETEHDMYASIDAAADSVKRKLRKYKERIIDAHRAGRPEAADFDAGEIEVVHKHARVCTRMRVCFVSPILVSILCSRE